MCILRLSALGDATHVVPVIRAISNHWPQTRISWIIGKLEHAMLMSLPGVEFIPFDKRGGLAAVKALRSELSGRKFDALLHMQVALRANVLSRFVNSPIRLGWDRARSRDRHHWFINHQIPAHPFQHQVQGFLEFARFIGASVGEPVWNLPIAEQDRKWAELQWEPGQPVLLISPCSSHTQRNWAPERYATVADHAISALGMKVVLSGGPGQLEQETAAAIESSMKNAAINLVGKDTIRQSLALLQRADVVISPDSGPVHIASALGTPVIGLYAATWSRRSGPFRSLDLCVDRFAEAARKFRHKEPEQLRWGTRIEVPGVMDLVKTEDVIEKLESTRAGR
ncbi:MAG: glycosyltransferase family 9 protein [Xanthomonadales bacterium]|nr:glycosyltransferase family 9 protein [Xanthomonadales bacterium]